MRDIRIPVPTVLSTSAFSIIVLARTTTQAISLARKIDQHAELDYYDLERDGTIVAVFTRE